MVREPEESDGIYRVLVRRALADEDPANVQVHFETAVLDKYRGAGAYKLIRTDTVGRLTRQGAWSIDFGIAPDESAIHACYAALLGLPPEDRHHWAAHALMLAGSSKFLQMRLFPNACFEDGELRPWQ